MCRQNWLLRFYLFTFTALICVKMFLARRKCCEVTTQSHSLQNSNVTPHGVKKIFPIYNQAYSNPCTTKAFNGIVEHTSHVVRTSISRFNRQRANRGWELPMSRSSRALLPPGRAFTRHLSTLVASLPPPEQHNLKVRLMLVPAREHAIPRGARQPRNLDEGCPRRGRPDATHSVHECD